MTEAGADRLHVVDALGIAGGRVVVTGSEADVRATAARGARVIDARGRAVIPGLHDAHIHLVELARARRGVDLSPAVDFTELRDRVAEALRDLRPGAWLRGRGWSAGSLPADRAPELAALVGDRQAFLGSRDGHSAWVSGHLLLRAGLDGTRDVPGGRIERDVGGRPNGILREKAVDLVRPVLEPLRGSDLDDALRDATAELSGWGITAVTDAGDFTADGGVGLYAALGDSFSSLVDGANAVSGRIRVTASVPDPALGAALAVGLRTGAALTEDGGIRVGWLKVFADGALGSRTAALFEPYTCDPGGDALGVMTLTGERLGELIRDAHTGGIALAVHAIGDRANATVIDAFEVADRDQQVSQGDVAPRDRIEHVQLTRAHDRDRIAGLGLVASVQPVHCPSDAATIDRCWGGREADAYAWRSLAEGGATLAFGSDAPVESPNPWLGMLAAVRRCAPRGEPWHPEHAVSVAEALRAYTIGPARALGRPDEGHLGPGACADLAVLSCSLDELLAADDRLAEVHAELTMFDGSDAS